jgi:predicted kinase
MMEALLFVGLQGAGKSSFYQSRFAETHLRINLDQLKTRHRERLVLLTTVQQKLNFVVDNTNATREQRAPYIQAAKAAGYKIVCYFFVPDIQRCLAQNARRSGPAKVHPAAIYGTRKKLEAPEFSEGFDQIFSVAINPENEVIVQPQARA